jgi:fucose 4-O-acetylase-like acetyltransferase
MAISFRIGLGSSPVAGGASVARAAWIDITRGMAELSVVTFHILQAMSHAGLTPKGLFNFWTPVGDMVRMPLMMFIAGMFVDYSLRKGPRAYFVGKTQRVVWPFLVWAHIYAIYWFLRPSGFDDRTPSELLLTIINPRSHLWFLQALFIYYVIVYFLLKQGLRVTVGVAAFVALTVPLAGNVIEPRLLYLLLFFTLGIAFNRRMQSGGFPFGPWVGLTLVVLAVALPVVITDTFGASKYQLIAIPASLVGVLASLAIARALTYVPGVRWLFTLMGAYALEIYCAHVVMSSGTRQILVRLFGWHAFWPLFLICTAAGVFLPIALAVGLRRFNIAVLFAWPALGKRKRSIALAPGTERAPQNF